MNLSTFRYFFSRNVKRFSNEVLIEKHRPLYSTIKTNLQSLKFLETDNLINQLDNDVSRQNVE